jgi:hypothetical protein
MGRFRPGTAVIVFGDGDLLALNPFRGIADFTPVGFGRAMMSGRM